eukprot:12437636-Alexandrium_andersonii.AAC.1
MLAAPRLRTRGGLAGPRRRADTARATSELVRARCGAAAPRGSGRVPAAVVSASAHPYWPAPCPPGHPCSGVPRCKVPPPAGALFLLAGPRTVAAELGGIPHVLVPKAPGWT